jgi:hypothetical protein
LVLRSEATEFRYERVEQPLPRIGPWRETLDEMLASIEAKPRRERLTLIRIFEALRGLGYQGGYDAVRRSARVWQRDRAASIVGAFIPLSFAPGRGLSVRLETASALRTHHHGRKWWRAHNWCGRSKADLSDLTV